MKPKQCQKPADVFIVVESTGPNKENIEAAIKFVKQLGTTLSDSLDGVQVNAIS